jgi:hypothetical protein
LKKPIRFRWFARLTAFSVLAGCAALPEGGVAFGLLGDTPYSESEVERLDRLIDDINAAPLAFVVHVGDIGSSRQACVDDWLQARKRQFARIRHPFVLLPGDNEWTDCRDPVERLAQWRKLFCMEKRNLSVEKQKGPYCEHIRWEAGGFVFVALNVPGSNNNIRHPEHGPRMAAVAAWLDEAAKLAESRDGLVVLMQANPFIILPRDGYADLRQKLFLLGEKLPGRIVLVHGDTHTWQDDEPLPGVRRIEVWGSPFVSWLGVAIAGGRLGASAPRYR